MHNMYSVPCVHFVMVGHRAVQEHAEYIHPNKHMQIRRISPSGDSTTIATRKPQTRQMRKRQSATSNQIRAIARIRIQHWQALQIRSTCNETPRRKPETHGPHLAEPSCGADRAFGPKKRVGPDVTVDRVRPWKAATGVAFSYGIARKSTGP